MSFNITMDFLGLDEVQREIERLATASELKDLNKKIVKKAGKVGLEESDFLPMGISRTRTTPSTGSLMKKLHKLSGAFLI